MHQARRTQDAPPSDREAEASIRVASCPPSPALLFPGLFQSCRGRTTEGTVLSALAVAELGATVTGAAASGLSTPAAGIPLLALSDLFTISVFDLVLESQRAQRLALVPQESLTELAAAPFSGQVLSAPVVWGGIAGSLAAGILVSALVDGIDTRNLGRRPVLFGREMNSAVGYPLGIAIGMGLFEHVALAEEMAFRGVLQSGLSRSYGESAGWMYSSLVFGLLHASNIVFLDRSQRLAYLVIGVPFITLLGSYLGLAYRSSGYSLAPSVAIHFWYDFLLSAAFFVADPRNSPLAVTWAIPF